MRSVQSGEVRCRPVQSDVVNCHTRSDRLVYMAAVLCLISESVKINNYSKSQQKLTVKITEENHNCSTEKFVMVRKNCLISEHIISQPEQQYIDVSLSLHRSAILLFGQTEN